MLLLFATAYIHALWFTAPKTTVPIELIATSGRKDA